QTNTDQATLGRNQADLATFQAALPGAIAAAAVSGNQDVVNQLNSLIGRLEQAVTDGTATVHGDLLTQAQTEALAQAKASENITAAIKEQEQKTAAANAAAVTMGLGGVAGAPGSPNHPAAYAPGETVSYN